MTDETPTAGLDSATASGPATVARPLPNPGDVVAERFQILRVLGAGSSAVVVAARDTHLEADVALKIFLHSPRDGGHLARLRREVQTARGQHPHAVTVYDLHATEDLEFLSMELVDGESLRRRIADRGPLEIDNAVEVARQIALALTWLHERRLIHRDIKPGNILLDRNGTAKLCDLGLVRPLEHGQTLTATDLVVGTPAYMAPEQATGDDLTPAADVFALGLVLFNALTGEVPLRGDTAVATLMRRQRERAPRLRSLQSGCPRWLDRLVAAMLEPEPAARPSSAEVASILTRQRLPWRPRRRTVIGAAVAVAAGLVAAWAGPQFVPSTETSRVTVTGDRIAGFDQRGRERWNVPLEGHVVSEQHEDLDGDGTDEIIVVSTTDLEDPERVEAPPPMRILAVTRNGRVLTNENTTALVHHWPFAYPKNLSCRIRAVQLDDGGGRELVVVARQTNHLPCTVLVYWTDLGIWQQILTHSGWLYDLAAKPDPIRPRLVFLGVNNRLELAHVIAQVGLNTSKEHVLNLSQRVLESPEIRGPINRSPNNAWEIYTILPPPDVPAEFGVAVVDGVIRPGGWSRIKSIDAFGNPVPGPNAGTDLRHLRQEMFRDLSALVTPWGPSGSMTPAETRRAVDAIGKKLEPLAAEPAYRGTIGILSARALARHGLPDLAIDRLSPLADRDDSEAVQHRLANIEAIHGDLDAALERTDALSRLTGNSRSDYDAVRLGLAIAIEQGDASTFEAYFRRLTGGRVGADQLGGLEASLRARARLWWDHLEPSDGSVRSFAYEPEGQAVACLARWRLDVTSSDDIAAMERFTQRNPDAATQGYIARAAVLLSIGRATEALEAVNDVLSSTRLDARDDFEVAQWRRLARALRVLALDAAGRPDLAADEACDLAARTPEHLLPARLIAPFVSDGC
jgi:hypothetical protein